MLLKVPDKKSQDKKDASINGFTTLLSKMMAPFFKIECPPERKFCYSPGTVHKDKPWSTAEMKRFRHPPPPKKLKYKQMEIFTHLSAKKILHRL